MDVTLVTKVVSVGSGVGEGDVEGVGEASVASFDGEAPELLFRKNIDEASRMIIKAENTLRGLFADPENFGAKYMKILQASA